MVNFRTSRNTGEPGKGLADQANEPQNRSKRAFFIKIHPSKVTAAARADPYFYGSSFTLLMRLNRTWASPSRFQGMSRLGPCRGADSWQRATSSAYAARPGSAGIAAMTGAAALRRRLAPAPSRAHDLPHNGAARRGTRARRRHFVDSDLHTAVASQ